MEVIGTDSTRKRLYLISQSGKFKNRIKKRSSIRCDDLWSPQIISPCSENPPSHHQVVTIVIECIIDYLFSSFKDII